MFYLNPLTRSIKHGVGVVLIVFICCMVAARGYVYQLAEMGPAGDACVDDSWTATSTENAPSARSGHTAVWTGTEMIVWGGRNFVDGRYIYFNTGGRYDPAKDTWVATSMKDAPSARSGHTAVWTGTEMIVWGGYEGNTHFNTGGRYDPAKDTWVATSMKDAPSARSDHTAVWTGTEMIVWGGREGNTHLNTGGRYDPATNNWTPTATLNAPSARIAYRAVWTGSEMIIWGGYGDRGGGDVGRLGTGGRYDPASDTWDATSLVGNPIARWSHTAVWTGTEMVVWGGSVSPAGGHLDCGGRYDPATDTWVHIGGGGVSARGGHTAIWTDTEMVVWGGRDRLLPLRFVNTGGRYDPATDSWTPTSTADAPSARDGHTAVWTGSEMIVWGGNPITNTGGRYCASAGKTNGHSAK